MKTTNLATFADASFGHRFFAGSVFNILGESPDQLLLEHATTNTRIRVSRIFFSEHFVTLCASAALKAPTFGRFDCDCSACLMAEVAA